MITEKDIVDASKSYFIAVVPRVFATVIYSYLPFLNVYPFNAMIDKLLTFICTKAADQADIRAFFIHVDFSVSKEGKDYVLAKKLLKNAEVKNDPEEIKKAQEYVKITMEKFAKLNN